MANQKFLLLGKVGKSQGLKGHFYVSSRGETLPKLEKIYISPTQPNEQFYRIKSQNWNGERNIISVFGVEDRTAAEAILHHEIWMLRSDLKLKSDEILWVDLEGLAVIADDGTPMGTIRQVANYGASDIVEIVKNGKLLSLPFIHDYFETANLVKFEKLVDSGTSSTLSIKDNSELTRRELTGILQNDDKKSEHPLAPQKEAMNPSQPRSQYNFIQLKQNAEFFSELWEDDKGE